MCINNYWDNHKGTNRKHLFNYDNKGTNRKHLFNYDNKGTNRKHLFSYDHVAGKIHFLLQYCSGNFE